MDKRAEQGRGTDTSDGNTVCSAGTSLSVLSAGTGAANDMLLSMLRSTVSNVGQHDFKAYHLGHGEGGVSFELGAEVGRVREGDDLDDNEDLNDESRWRANNEAWPSTAPMASVSARSSAPTLEDDQGTGRDSDASAAAERRHVMGNHEARRRGSIGQSRLSGGNLRVAAAPAQPLPASRPASKSQQLLRDLSRSQVLSGKATMRRVRGRHRRANIADYEAFSRRAGHKSAAAIIRTGMPSTSHTPLSKAARAATAGPRARVQHSQMSPVSIRRHSGGRRASCASSRCSSVASKASNGSPRDVMVPLSEVPSVKAFRAKQGSARRALARAHTARSEQWARTLQRQGLVPGSSPAPTHQQQAVPEDDNWELVSPLSSYRGSTTGSSTHNAGATAVNVTISTYTGDATNPHITTVDVRRVALTVGANATSIQNSQLLAVRSLQVPAKAIASSAARLYNHQGVHMKKPKPIEKLPSIRHALLRRLATQYVLLLCKHNFTSLGAHHCLGRCHQVCRRWRGPGRSSHDYPQPEAQALLPIHERSEAQGHQAVGQDQHGACQG